MQLSWTIDVVSFLSFRSYWRKECLLEAERKWKMWQQRLCLGDITERGTVWCSVAAVQYGLLLVISTSFNITVLSMWMMLWMPPICHNNFIIILQIWQTKNCSLVHLVVLILNSYINEKKVGTQQLFLLENRLFCHFPWSGCVCVWGCRHPPPHTHTHTLLINPNANAMPTQRYPTLRYATPRHVTPDKLCYLLLVVI